MKPNKMQYVLLAVLVLGLGGLTIVYASLTQKLEIRSTAAVEGNTWNVQFDELVDGAVETAKTTGAAVVESQPTLGTASITDLDVTLSKPGDTVTYTFKIANKGTIDAEIADYKINSIADGITVTGSGDSADADAQLVRDNLIFTLTYADATTAEETGSVIAMGTPVAAGQELKAGQEVTVKLTVGFNQAATAVPANDVTIAGLDVDIDYLQD